MNSETPVRNEPSQGKMKRRDFLTKGTLAAGLASSPGLLDAAAGEAKPVPLESTTTSQQTVKAPEEIRSAEYLRRARGDKFLPKMPVYTESYLSGVKIVPMPLAERRQAQDRAAAGLLQHRARQRCASHLRQWSR